MADLIRYGGVIAGQEEIDAAAAVLAGQGWASGPVTARFEEAAAAAQGRAHALFVNSGSSALLLALATLPRGSKIAMPALQFPTLYSAAVWCGLQPVLVDIDDSLNMSPAGLAEAALHHRDLAAAAFVHMAGNPSGIAEIAEFCQITGLVLIEDICEAFGASADGIFAGNFGLASATSTHAAHQISTGEGGLVFTGEVQAYEKMRRMRDWGRAYGTADLDGYYPGYVFSETGLNLHATDIQAAVGLVQLGRLPEFVAVRRRNYEYLAGKTHLPFTRPRVDGGCEPSWYTFPVLTGSRPARNRLAAHLASWGIESRPVVAGNMARQPVTGGTWDPAGFPVADMVFERGLWISVHPALTEDDLARIAAALNEFRDW